MHFQLLLTALASGLVPLAVARTADTRMYLSDTCRTIESMGMNTCAYCNWDGVPRCDYDAYWNMCLDKPNPNPCRPDEILALDSRDYKFNYDEKCSKVCPDVYCYSYTMKYKDQCCTCPPGFRPSVTPPHCLGSRGSGVAVNCVGCAGANEVLVGDDKKGWECLPKAVISLTRSSSSSSTPSKSSTSTKPVLTPKPSVCDQTCGKDSWCPKAHWVTKVVDQKTGKTSKNCFCDSGVCKDKKTTCPSSCFKKKPSADALAKCPPGTCWDKAKQVDSCRPNQAGVDLIKAVEGFCTTYYNVCDNKKTIGYGHNCNDRGGCNNLVLPLSDCEAERLFNCDIDYLTDFYVKKLPNYKKLSHNMFSALASLNYNKPSLVWKGSSVYNAMNVPEKDWDYKKVCQAILTATKNDKNRRQKESDLCMKPPLTPKTC